MLPPDAPTAAPRSARFRRALMLAIVMVFAPGALPAQQRPDRIAFNIPAQPLSGALYSFSAASGVEVLVDARNAAGRRSSTVTGTMPPHQALQVLLAGSHLVAKEFAPGTVTLSVPEAANAPGARFYPYFAEIQRAVEQTLCHDSRTLPGAYRVALKLWIGPSGEVVRSKRLDTTGDSDRDAALDAVVSSVRVGSPPPAELPQPVALIVSPGYTPENSNCAPAIRRASHR